MKVLWISALPAAVEQRALGSTRSSTAPAVSWILGHLPPPPEVELHVATLWPGAREYRQIEYRGSTFHLIPCPSKGRALLLFWRDTTLFRPLFDKLRPDVVHGWGTEDSFALAARRLAPRRHLIGVQGLINECRKRGPMPARTLLTAFTERLTLSKAQWVVAESQYSLRAARPMCPDARLREIEHPLREEFLTAEIATGTAKQVLFVGNLSHQKGFGDALSAFAKTAHPDWTLHVIGTGESADETALPLTVEKLGIRDRFIHQRNVGPDELSNVMRSSSVFLLPTRIDTGPTALKEALAMGLWPVCYDNSGPGEYIRQLRFGSLARDLDHDNLCQLLSEVLRARPWLDSTRRADLLRQTRTRFAKQEIWPKLYRLYKEILEH